MLHKYVNQFPLALCLQMGIATRIQTNKDMTLPLSGYRDTSSGHSFGALVQSAPDNFHRIFLLDILKFLFCESISKYRCRSYFFGHESPHSDNVQNKTDFYLDDFPFTG